MTPRSRPLTPGAKTVRPQRINFDDHASRRRPGWEAPRDHPRPSSAGPVSRIICHVCYVKNDHIAPACTLPFKDHLAHDMRYIVPKQHRVRLKKLLRKYSSMWDGSLGEINTTEHSIELQPGTKSIAQPPYRAGPKQRQAEQAEVDRRLEHGVIEPTQSAWASAVLLVPKPDGSLRFIIPI